MGIDKAEISKSTLTRVGAHVEAQLEEAEKLVSECKGAAVALREQGKNLLAIVAAADKALDDKKSPDHIPDLETLKLVKVWVNKAVTAVNNAAMSRKNHGLVAQGAVEQLKRTHDYLQKQVDVENARIASALQAKELLKQVVDNTGSLPDGVMLDSDGDPVWVGEGNPPQGIRPGNRMERQAYVEAKQKLEQEKAAAEAAPSNGAKKKAPRKKAAKKKAPGKKVAARTAS